MRNHELKSVIYFDLPAGTGGAIMGNAFGKGGNHWGLIPEDYYTGGHTIIGGIVGTIGL